MKKKIWAILLCAALFFSHIPARAEETRQLTVGNTTQMKGDFFTDMWGSATSDVDVRMLLHGYNLVRWDAERMMYAVDDSVVSGLTALKTEQGDYRFILSLYDDLRYSDGTAITAWDYAFSYLLAYAPEMREIGARQTRSGWLAGGAEYGLGLSPVLSGVRVTGDHRMEITVSKEYLPYFYELALIACKLYPIHVIAPGCAVKDDGEGVYIANADPDAQTVLFTADLLRETVLDPEAGYRSHPSVVSGPYMLDSFDGTTAVFSLNPYYKGDRDGTLPPVERLVYTLAENETMIDQLAAGELDIINKASAREQLMRGLQLTLGSEEYTAGYYPRQGLSMISFCCERPAMGSQAVRQAIACCLDKDALVEAYVGGFGLRVDGYYGLGQWMYRLVQGAAEYPMGEDGQTADWEALSLEGVRRYDLDPAAAKELLIADGWTLNRRGEPFQEGQDDFRCKIIGDDLVALVLTMIYPEGNGIGEALNDCFVPYLRQAGIELIVEPCPMTELLERYYGQRERNADLIYLATNFAEIFDPAESFIPGGEGQRTWNNTALSDAELYRLAVEMRRVEPGDALEYCRRWIAFQERFAEVLPALPVYSNVYYDFSTSRLHNYRIADYAAWPQALMHAFLAGDAPWEDWPGEDFEDGEEAEYFFDD